MEARMKPETACETRRKMRKRRKEMEESRKLSGRDLITIGIFSAIYFVLNLAAMITGFVPVLWLLLPGVAAIVTGIPFMLLAWAENIADGDGVKFSDVVRSDGFK